jgi:predicted aldo/keto reductase-like oxidoreductase
MKKNRSGMTRRRFIQSTAGAVAAVSASGFVQSLGIMEMNGNNSEMMHRQLGKTGLDVSILSFGGGSQFLRNPDGKWEKLLETAIEGGINLFDTAPGYIASKMGDIWDGKSVDSSEERYGKILPAYRKQIILSTKLDTRKPEEAKAEFETSLKKLKTDHVDILFIHAIELSDNISDIENGVYKSVVSFKESGAVRYMGFSSMGDAEHASKLLDRLDFDVVLVAMNATQYGNFAKFVLPVARKKNTGVMSMKLMRDIVGKAATPGELFNYALSHEGVATGLIGHAGMDALADNINVARAFTAGKFDII